MDRPIIATCFFAISRIFFFFPHILVYFFEDPMIIESVLSMRLIIIVIRSSSHIDTLKDIVGSDSAQLYTVATEKSVKM